MILFISRQIQPYLHNMTFLTLYVDFDRRTRTVNEVVPQQIVASDRYFSHTGNAICVNKLQIPLVPFLHHLYQILLNYKLLFICHFIYLF